MIVKQACIYGGFKGSQCVRVDVTLIVPDKSAPGVDLDEIANYLLSVSFFFFFFFIVSYPSLRASRFVHKGIPFTSRSPAALRSLVRRFQTHAGQDHGSGSGYGYGKMDLGFELTKESAADVF